MSIETVKIKYEEQLMQRPNVVGVAIGEKGGREVIKVFVSRKVPEPSLRPEQIIPETLEGFEVDVEEIGTVTTQT